MVQKTLRKLPHVRHFAGKLLRNVIAGSLFLIFSLFLGILGYHHYFSLGWIDSLYNASMILTGMGPVNSAPTADTKIFASFYAIYSGVAFLTGAAIILGPIAHRFLHKLKLEIEDQ